MEITKIYNNNVVLSNNHLGEEIVVMGRGLAFQKKIGDKLDPKFIEKTFVLTPESSEEQLHSLFKDVPYEEIEIAKEIIQIAEEKLAVTLNSSIYLTLTDHIHYALVRAREGLVIANPLLFDIKRFYPKPFESALAGVQLIKERLAVSLGEEEAGFITFHIVNAMQNEASIQQTMEITQMVHDVLNIITFQFGRAFNENSLSYSRIVTHLQYFFQRIQLGKEFEDEDDFMYDLVKKKYPAAFTCVEKIQQYILKKMKYQIKKSEAIYLTIHIQHVVSEK